MKIDLSRFDDKELWKILGDIGNDLNLEQRQDATTIILAKVVNGVRKELDKRLENEY